jgi:hypothetical protein
MTRPSLRRGAGFAIATAMVVAGLVVVVLGHGIVGTLLLLGGGVAIGALLPPGTGSTSDTHGASDSTD